MEDNLKKAALNYHRYPHPGKIEVVPTKPYETTEDLALAYSPGVAYPCLEIKDDANRPHNELDIPLMHDDQHGTAIISSVALLNALKLQDKNIKDVRLVVNGAWAAAIACTRLFCQLGMSHENIVMRDSKGVIRVDRDNLNASKREFATIRDRHCRTGSGARTRYNREGVRRQAA